MKNFYLDKTVIDRLDNSELYEEFMDLKWNWYLGSQTDQRCVILFFSKATI